MLHNKNIFLFPTLCTLGNEAPRSLGSTVGCRHSQGLASASQGHHLLLSIHIFLKTTYFFPYVLFVFSARWKESHRPSRTNPFVC